VKVAIVKVCMWDWIENWNGELLDEDCRQEVEIYSKSTEIMEFDGCL